MSRWARALLVLGSILLMSGVLTGIVNREVLDGTRGELGLRTGRPSRGGSGRTGRLLGRDRRPAPRPERRDVERVQPAFVDCRLAAQPSGGEPFRARGGDYFDRGDLFAEVDRLNGFG